MTMLDFNLWAWNSRIFPGIESLNVRLNDKVRIRIGNLTMTNHPIHLHGHEFHGDWNRWRSDPEKHALVLR
jgi:FtsP/CotA-like multicopper oxidase with cupredoxin domain